MTESRFPDGYMHYLYHHQYQAKSALEEDQETKKAKSIRKPKPSRLLYVAPGARTNKTEITDMNANISTPDGTKHSQCGNFDLPVLENNVLTFSSEEEKEVAINMVDIDIESYLPTARPLILQAIYEPDSLMNRVLEEVGGYIVNRAWEDTTYHNTAADLCVFICVKERYGQRNFLPIYAFLRSLMIHTQELVGKWDEMRAARLDYWHGFVRFMIRLFRRLSERDFGIILLAEVLVNIAEALLTPLCLPNAVDRELLVLLLEDCGKYIQNTKEQLLIAVINRIRDLILEPHPDVKVREHLIHAVELYCSNWSLSKKAQAFYNS